MDAAFDSFIENLIAARRDFRRNTHKYWMTTAEASQGVGAGGF